FDLHNDPDELHDLGEDPAHAAEIERLKGIHFDWTRQHHNRTTISAESVEARTDEREPPGIYIAYANKKELEDDGLTLPPHAQQ
ncbi:MAG: phosphonate monoester hydrolase, partial [Pseudomonadota bacterium]